MKQKDLIANNKYILSESAEGLLCHAISSQKTYGIIKRLENKAVAVFIGTITLEVGDRNIFYISDGSIYIMFGVREDLDYVKPFDKRYVKLHELQDKVNELKQELGLN